MCLKAAEEEIAKRQAVFNQGLKNLAIAIRNLQYIIKEIIDPEAAGITKEILSSIPGDPRADKKLTEFTRKEHKDEGIFAATRSSCKTRCRKIRFPYRQKNWTGGTILSGSLQEFQTTCSTFQNSRPLLPQRNLWTKGG
ncbi:hypothetical protein TNCT_453861 [Trichonephila clavata]|uniref:Uncharacterized protein n=1 Tax=Trichonephila clavata TaxID=2740835 RepID=A0A8X6LPR2_TRICU|nr:hypothetical protein TNCT_453861 [Trichonephila clavata]